jgi:predicted PurR-regulated permease PerM
MHSVRWPLAALAITVLIAGFSVFYNVLLLFGLIVLYRVFQDYVLSPYLMSENVGVSPPPGIVGLLADCAVGQIAKQLTADSANKIAAER